MPNPSGSCFKCVTIVFFFLQDVLLQFAKMSSRQGHANPVDMIQVGKESPGTSGNSTMAGSSGSSSAAALQSLAAARNARSSPHTAGLSAGSILQSALSGSRTNPNFAPTLAQLLTNPANEQHLQHPQQSPLGGNQPTVSIPIATASSSSSSAAVAAAAAAASVASSAEVLTLSNLLATARVLEKIAQFVLYFTDVIHVPNLMGYRAM